MLVLTFYTYFKPSPKVREQKTTVVKAATVQKSSIQQQAEFKGFVQAEQQTTLYAKAQGVLRIFKESGESVEKGVLIAKIENHDVDNNYRLLKESEALAQIQYDRWTKLAAAGVVSKDGVDDKKNVLLEAKKRLSDAKIAVSELRLYAPFKGVVGLFKYRDGTQLQSGNSIVSFYDPSSLMVEFDIPLDVAERVHNGSETFVQGKSYTLSHFQKMLDDETHMCPAFVKIDCPTCIIRASCDVRVVTDAKEGVIVIPFGAVFLREGKSFVYIVKDSKAVLTSLSLGIRDKDRVEVTEGLSGGETLVVEGHGLLYPDAAVTIVP